MEYWPFMGICECHSHSKLCHLCYLASLFKLLSSPPHSRTPPTHPIIYAGPILMNPMKNGQKLVKIIHYLLARLVVHKLKDNQVLLCSLNKSNTETRLAFLICKLDGLLLRQLNFRVLTRIFVQCQTGSNFTCRLRHN